MVVVHTGDLVNDGHYVVYIKLNNQWVLFNDLTRKNNVPLKIRHEVSYIVFFTILNYCIFGYCCIVFLAIFELLSFLLFVKYCLFGYFCIVFLTLFFNSFWLIFNYCVFGYCRMSIVACIEDMMKIRYLHRALS